MFYNCVFSSSLTQQRHVSTLIMFDYSQSMYLSWARRKLFSWPGWASWWTQSPHQLRVLLDTAWGAFLYNFFVIMLSSIHNTWPSQFGICVLMKEVMVFMCWSIKIILLNNFVSHLSSNSIVDLLTTQVSPPLSQLVWLSTHTTRTLLTGIQILTLQYFIKDKVCSIPSCYCINTCFLIIHKYR